MAERFPVDAGPHSDKRKQESHMLGLFKTLRKSTGAFTKPSDLLPYLGRLGAVAGGSNNISPNGRLTLALETVKTGSVNQVARRYNLATSTVLRSLRDATATMVYLSGYSDDEVGIEIEKRVQNLKEAEKNLAFASKTRNHPEAQRLLMKIPHVRDLLDTYLTFGTVKHELVKAGVTNFTDYQLRSVGKYLREPQVEKSMDGLTTLSQRYVLGRWLNESKEVNHRGDKAISEAAALVFVTENVFPAGSRKFDTVRDMRIFLTEIMMQEFDYAVANQWTEIKAFFPGQKKGKTAKKREEINMLKAYEAFARANFCPLGLRAYARLVRDGVRQPERIKSLRPGVAYSPEWLNSIDWAGIKFMENGLSRIESIEFSADMIVQNTGDILKTIKQRIGVTN
jgi:hypothetical protein